MVPLEASIPTPLVLDEETGVPRKKSGLEENIQTPDKKESRQDLNPPLTVSQRADRYITAQ